MVQKTQPITIGEALMKIESKVQAVDQQQFDIPQVSQQMVDSKPQQMIEAKLKKEADEDTIDEAEKKQKEVGGAAQEAV